MTKETLKTIERRRIADARKAGIPVRNRAALDAFHAFRADRYSRRDEDFNAYAASLCLGRAA